MRKALSLLAFAVFIFGLMLTVKAEAASDITVDFKYIAADTDNPAEVSVSHVEGENWLFLPSCTDVAAMKFSFDGSGLILRTENGSVELSSGEPCDMSEVLTPAADGVCRAELVTEDEEGGETVTPLNIMLSANIRAMFITSADGVNAGREWLEQSKNNKPKGNGLVLLTDGGETVFDGKMKNMKGRGNSTWGYDKKPYQIKLKESADLLENGEPAETWVLLANVCDSTMSRTHISFTAAEILGLDFTPHCEFTDLYFDGEYRGTYVLSEKTEIGENRIEIHDLEGDIAEANTEDVESMQTAQAVNSYGCTFQYVAGANAPENFLGGYLLELDYPDRALEETSWFTTRDGEYVVIKSPEYAPYELVKYISEYWQEFADAVDNGGTNPYNGKKISDYIDVESLVKCMVLQEYAKNGDAFASSAYFYKDAEGKMYAGPVWDFDTCYGAFLAPSLQLPEGSLFGGDGVLKENNIAVRLMKLEQIQAAFKSCWFEELRPGVESVILADETVEGSISCCTARVMASQRMNNRLWVELPFRDVIPALSGGCFEDDVEWLRGFIAARMAWMDEYAGGMGAPCREIELYAQLPRLVEVEDGGKSGEPVTEWVGETTLYQEYEAFVSIEESQWSFDEQSGFTLRVIMSVNGSTSIAEDMRIKVNGGECRWTIDENGGIEAEISFLPVSEEGCAFEDVEPAFWYYNAILSASERGILSGIRENEFSPEGKLSRAMLVSVLWRMAGCPQAGTVKFSDVNADAWFADAVAWAGENGIVSGVGGGLFAPDSAITREQLMCVLRRYGEYMGLDTQIEETDIPEDESVSEWARESVGWAVRTGLYDFAGNGILRADEKLTRAETAWVMTHLPYPAFPEPDEEEKEPETGSFFVPAQN